MNYKHPFLFTFYILTIAGLIAAGAMLNGCSGSGDGSTYSLTGDTLVDGKNLVQINCTKCHALVPVNALNKDVWKHHTLPAMARYLGVTPYLGGYFKSEKDTSGLTLLEYQMIEAYYDKLAPDTLLEAKKPTPLINDWAGFTLRMPAKSKNVSFTTMAAVDPASHKIYTSDNTTAKLTEWGSDLKMGPSVDLPSTAVNAVFKKGPTGANNVLLSCIGRIEPIDFPNGKLLNVNLDGKTAPAIVADDIERPVQTIEADFNKDGLPDEVVLAQGNKRGGVYLLKQNADHTYSQSNISDKPGAVQAVTGDFDNDGWPDVMVLFGSGDEGLWLYTNDHKGGFTTKNLLRFPPVYGSTSFQLVDIDHDGKPDLIYTCGYNFHDSRIFKPYHGLYIFKNTGNWNFKEEWFYPINGCTKAIAADFDGDGNIDIATIAFFANLKDTPAESFIYFKQAKPLTFEPHALPISQYGHWMTLDVADYNNDGKPDIILGNYSTGFLFQYGLKPSWDKNTPFVVLENKM